MSLPQASMRSRRASRSRFGEPPPSEQELLEQLMRSLAALRRANAGLRAISRANKTYAP